MTRLEFIYKSLIRQTLTTSQLTDYFYEECSDLVDEKRRYYISKNSEKTEKELRTQIQAEFSSVINRSTNKKYFLTSKDGYSLSEEGKKEYTLNYLKDDMQEYIIEDIDITDVEITEEFNKRGIIYLLKSSSFKDVYKIGKTIDLNKRMYDLKRDHRYGVFALEPIMYIDCEDYHIIERVFHKFFEDYRLCKKNDILVDTELFKGLDTIEDEFKLFSDFLESNPRFKKSQLFIL